MAAAVRNCAGLTRALARSGTGIRLLAARGNTGAVPATLLRKLTTSSSWRAGRSEEEINKWVETELSRVRAFLLFHGLEVVTMAGTSKYY